MTEQCDNGEMQVQAEGSCLGYDKCGLNLL
jgi:hypothetical protein